VLENIVGPIGDLKIARAGSSKRAMVSDLYKLYPRTYFAAYFGVAIAA